MDTTFNSQMVFGWADQTNVFPLKQPISANNPNAAVAIATRSAGHRVRHSPAVAATAKPLEDTAMDAPKSKMIRRNRTEHVSDLLLVVLEKYGIDADEFLDGLNN